ncbi:MAG: hypothetical protein PSX42_22650, partial [bacterium]|nr:hypothetical protein [bacterium]
TDCDSSTDPVSGQLCFYLGSGWATIEVNSKSVVTTGKKSDTNNPTYTSVSAATFNGVLEEINGAPPTETGIVYKPITNAADFSALPLLDVAGVATSPIVKKATGTAVITEGGAISVPVTGLTAYPYYFRAYAKSSLGIGYGNTVIFNCAIPSFSAPVVTDGTTLLPKFSTTLTINAGTAPSAVTEYGYYSGATANPTINKVILSTPASLASLAATLNSESFTANPTLTLNVDDYYASTSTLTYLRFYVIANGVTTYSSNTSFTPGVDSVTGGTAIATVVSIGTMSPQAQIEVALTGVIPVTFNVTKTGTYIGRNATMAGNTTGLTMGTFSPGSFSSTGMKVVNFTVTGTPATSIDGKTWTFPVIGALSTGTILKGDIIGGKARCYDALYNTTVIAEITSTKTGRTWMDRNLGASSNANAPLTSVDYNYTYGCFYQYGRGNDGHASVNNTSLTSSAAFFTGTSGGQSSSSTPGNTDFYNVGVWFNGAYGSLWIGTENNPCPVGYSVPTVVEMDNEIGTSIVNSATAASSSLHLQAAGRRNYTGSYEFAGEGWYWTTFTGYGFRAGDVYKVSGIVPGYGMSVRCIKNLP